MTVSDTPDWLTRGRNAVWPPYARFDAEVLPVVAASGATITATDSYTF